MRGAVRFMAVNAVKASTPARTIIFFTRVRIAKAKAKAAKTASIQAFFMTRLAVLNNSSAICQEAT